MKKHIVIILALICFMVVSTACSGNDAVNYELNEELYGNPYGRDYRGHVGDGKFQIMHVHYDSLLMLTEKNMSDRVLEYEYKHTFDKNEVLYFYSADGYAVVDPKDNSCRVFITSPPLELVKGEDAVIHNRVAENNYCIRKLEGEKYECITYLDSFDEFTEYEQKMLIKLKDKHKK